MTNEDIVKQIKSGISVESNMEKLYCNNLPLIKMFIRPYLSIVAEDEKEDLLQEAYIGLFKAVEHFSFEYDFSFMTYAEKVIKQNVRRYINKNCFLVKIPENLKVKIAALKKVTLDYQTEFGKTPTTAQLAQIMTLSEKEINELQVYNEFCFNFDFSVTSEDEEPLCDTIKGEINVEEEAINKLYQGQTLNLLWGILKGSLNELEVAVLYDRFKYDMTYRKLSEKYNLTIAKVRDIEHNAIRRLRHGTALRKLLEQYEISTKYLYKTSFNCFSRESISSVEKIALRKYETQAGCYI